MVIHFAGRCYVVRNCDADTEWNEEFAKMHVMKENSRWCASREKALIMAHNAQNSQHTEYGVRELFIGPKRKRPRDPVVGDT